MFGKQKIFIKEFLTHAEYSGGKVEKMAVIDKAVYGELLAAGPFPG